MLIEDAGEDRLDLSDVVFAVLARGKRFGSAIGANRLICTATMIFAGFQLNDELSDRRAPEWSTNAIG